MMRVRLPGPLGARSGAKRVGGEGPGARVLSLALSGGPPADAGT